MLGIDLSDAQPVTRSLNETLAAAQRGERPALDALFARHVPPLVAFLRNKAGGVVVQRESVHDLAQSVCREALLELGDLEFEDEAAFRSWLFFRATRKVMKRHRFHHQARRDVKREQPPAGAGTISDGDLVACYASLCTPSRHASAREELGRIEAALAQLSQEQRDAVVYSRVMGLDYADVARQMGRSASAVRGLVARGLARLSVMLATDPPSIPRPSLTSSLPSKRGRRDRNLRGL
jgi:RNA polymerase sigma-70 factor (ECF subfamily)